MDSIKVSLSDEETIKTSVKDLNYIPAYKEYEEERQNNELQRIANENERISYYEEIQNKVNTGEINLIYDYDETLKKVSLITNPNEGGDE